MKVDLLPGNYVVAVSGGVDSMVLLDVLARLPNVQLTVAHFDHGIRTDSHEDRKLVQQTAQSLGLPFVYKVANLGPASSEQQARDARYAFLRKVKGQARADAIITAHHQDDVLETFILNMRRGTGRKGLSSLQSTSELIRPLLKYTKTELLQYAKERGVVWREDSTNKSDKYARNYLRLHILPKLAQTDRDHLLDIHQRMQSLNQQIDEQLREVIASIGNENGVIVRKKFVMLPHAIASEVMAQLLREHDVRNMSRRLVARLVVATKIGSPHTMYDVDKKWVLTLSPHRAEIIPRKTRKNV